MGIPDPRTAGWRAHEEEQRRSWLRLTPAERLAWLEQAREFVAGALGAAYRKPPNGEGEAKGDSR